MMPDAVALAAIVILLAVIVGSISLCGGHDGVVRFDIGVVRTLHVHL
jgi:hypothetical protein